MTSSRSVSPASLPTVRNSIIPEFLSVTSTNLPSDNLYNISYQLKRMRDEQHSLTLIEQQKTSKMTGLLPKNSILLMNTPQQQSTIINTPTHELQKISHFHLNRSKNNEKKLDVHQSNKKFLKYLFIFLHILRIKLNINIDQKIDLIIPLIALPIVQSSSSVS
jgi:hypothetical protein